MHFFRDRDIERILIRRSVLAFIAPHLHGLVKWLGTKLQYGIPLEKRPSLHGALFVSRVQLQAAHLKLNFSFSVVQADGLIAGLLFPSLVARWVMSARACTHETM